MCWKLYLFQANQWPLTFELLYGKANFISAFFLNIFFSKKSNLFSHFDFASILKKLSEVSGQAFSTTKSAISVMPDHSLTHPLVYCHNLQASLPSYPLKLCRPVHFMYFNLFQVCFKSVLLSIKLRRLQILSITSSVVHFTCGNWPLNAVIVDLSTRILVVFGLSERIAQPWIDGRTNIAHIHITYLTGLHLP